MLGIYDYTVVLTYVSLMVSIGGMMLSVNGHLNLAVLCLAISGLCDMFDGKIARTKKDRTEEEKCFGIQIDSLCDIVCFGVGPAIILPLVVVFRPLLGKEFMVALHAAVLVVGLLFITDFKLRKPKNATLVVLVVIVAAAVLKILHVCQ